MTEQEILKKFKELGYEVFVIERHSIALYKFIEKYNEEYSIIIDLVNKCYYCECMEVIIDMQIHQLLTELFKCWGWFDD